MTAYHHYVSYEAIWGRPPDEPAHVFTLCVLLCELVDGAHPLGLDPTRSRFVQFEVLDRIRAMQYRLPPAGAAFVDVMRSNIVRDRAARMSFEQLKQALITAATSSGLSVGPHVIAETLAAVRTDHTSPA